MNGGSWPYFPQQCPHCMYLDPDSPAYVDDSGYQITGFCRHPRITMELFEPRQRRPSPLERCPLFFPRATDDR